MKRSAILARSPPNPDTYNEDSIMLGKGGKLEGRLSPEGRLTSTKSTCLEDWLREE